MADGAFRAAEAGSLDGMRRLAGGAFAMGSDRHYPEEAPARRVAVDPFWIDETPVTNRAFAQFVAATGHVTLAEQPPDPADYPGMRLDLVRSASLVFDRAGPGEAYAWSLRFDACWHRPLGAGSDFESLEDHPVVHVAHADAAAFAAWAGKALPTEAEWEYAARGGLEGRDYAWGDTLAPDGARLANYWDGPFPFARRAPAGEERTSAVGAYPANGYGLFDMIGNVWEWTDDWYRGPGAQDCCGMARNPAGGSEAESRDPATPDLRTGRKVLKGGSHLCAENYCRRYRPAARWPQPVDTATSHVGFRCIRRIGSQP
jgi:formylglycine-generating enzyme required for sulfatase activity